jgi:hypothetical protein
MTQLPIDIDWDTTISVLRKQAQHRCLINHSYTKLFRFGEFAARIIACHNVIGLFRNGARYFGTGALKSLFCLIPG